MADLHILANCFDQLVFFKYIYYKHGSTQVTSNLSSFLNNDIATLKIILKCPNVKQCNKTCTEFWQGQGIEFTHKKTIANRILCFA